MSVSSNGRSIDSFSNEVVCDIIMEARSPLQIDLNLPSYDRNLL